MLDRIVSAFLLPVMEIWLCPYFGITVAQIYNDLSGYAAPMYRPEIRQ